MRNTDSEFVGSKNSQILHRSSMYFIIRGPVSDTRRFGFMVGTPSISRGFERKGLINADR